MVTKEHYLEYKMRPSGSLVVYVRIVYHKYLNLKSNPISLTGEDRIYGLLMSMSDH